MQMRGPGALAHKLDIHIIGARKGIELQSQRYGVQTASYLLLEVENMRCNLLLQFEVYTRTTPRIVSLGTSHKILQMFSREVERRMRR